MRGQKYQTCLVLFLKGSDNESLVKKWWLKRAKVVGRGWVKTRVIPSQFLAFYVKSESNTQRQRRVARGLGLEGWWLLPFEPIVQRGAKRGLKGSICLATRLSPSMNCVE